MEKIIIVHLTCEDKSKKYFHTTMQIECQFIESSFNFNTDRSFAACQVTGEKKSKRVLLFLFY
jgi:hypothetical protein